MKRITREVVSANAFDRQNSAREQEIASPINRVQSIGVVRKLATVGILQRNPGSADTARCRLRMKPPVHRILVLGAALAAHRAGGSDAMTEILLFHHAQGQTPGFLAFADDLRAAGHVVHTPDLYDGNTFPDLDAGIGYAKQVGFGTILERGRASAEGLPDDLVYAGFSLGVMPAQLLTQTRPGARGALFFSAALPCCVAGSRCFPSGYKAHHRGEITKSKGLL